jgi:Ion channel
MVMLQRHPKCLGGLGALRSGELPEIPRLLPVLGYFSMTTLSTLGFGDITPLAMPPVAEGITGQFYMAILVARLVGLHMSHSAGPRDR